MTIEEAIKRLEIIATNLCGLSFGETKSMIPFFAHGACVTSWEGLSMLRLAKPLCFNAHTADSQLKVTRP